MEGQINTMHSKLQLLSHTNHLRIVVPSANLVPYDWYVPILWLLSCWDWIWELITIPIRIFWTWYCFAMKLLSQSLLFANTRNRGETGVIENVSASHPKMLNMQIGETSPSQLIQTDMFFDRPTKTSKWSDDGSCKSPTICDWATILSWSNGLRARSNQQPDEVWLLSHSTLGICSYHVSIYINLNGFGYHLILCRGGSHSGNVWNRTGYCGLGAAVKQLGLQTEDAANIDFVVWNKRTSLYYLM